MATKNLLAAAALIAMGATVAGTAQADALAQSTLTVSNFQIFTGGVALDRTDFAAGPLGLTLVDSTTLTANLNGSNSGGPAVPATFDGSGLPLQIVCAPGGACPSPMTLATIPAVQTGSTAGSFLAGAPITGIVTTAGPVPSPATAGTGALSEVLGLGLAGAQSGLTLSSLLSFTTAHAINNISLSFNASLILNAWASALSFNSATAGSALSFTLVDQVTNTELFRWSPTGGTGGIAGGTVTSTGGGCNLNASVTSNSPPGGTNTGSCTGSFAANIGVSLLANHAYSFGITQQSNSTVISTNAIPEPSGLALASLALLSLGVVGRRRKSK